MHTLYSTDNAVALHHMMVVGVSSASKTTGSNAHQSPLPPMQPPSTSNLQPPLWNLFHSNRTSSGLASSSALPPRKDASSAPPAVHRPYLTSPFHPHLNTGGSLSFWLKSMIGQGREKSPEAPRSVTLKLFFNSCS